MIFPTYQNYCSLSKEYNLIPVYKNVSIDMDTPISVFLKVCQSDAENYLLESVEGGESLARFSFIGLEPFLTFHSKDNEGSIISEGAVQRTEGSPLKTLREIMTAYKAPALDGLPRFYGGAVGYFGYDIISHLEDIPPINDDDLDVPDCYFMLASVVLIFDHPRHLLKVVINTKPGSDPEAAYQKATAKVDEIIAKLNQSLDYTPNHQPQKTAQAKITSNLSRQEYIDKVKQAKEYIRAGDIFQVVLSQRFSIPVNARPFEIYRSLRTANPAPYLFYLNFKEHTLIGSSPEMLVRVEDGRVETRPIAGTRPRGKDIVEDREYELELLADMKEKAEHLMLVDLGRNDLGRVSQFGSIQLGKFMDVERYSHVMHLVTVVKGQLAANKTAFDALEACFPAGTLSGAPKVRAMEIIRELEPTRRGPYAGAIGYFGFTGNMDSCITIRTVLIKGNMAYLQAGAGIVNDSIPEVEYQETINKAKALLKILTAEEVSQ